MSSPICIGILHSQHGPMAVDEIPLIDAALMAVDEINERGGLLGQKIKAITVDGFSDDVSFARGAVSLIDEHNVCAIFGCWTSSSRKAVKPVVEEKHSLLWYPIQYEGLEQSPHIVYTGSCLNQQIAPVIDWAHSVGKCRIALVGSDYVFPRTANKLASSMLAGTCAKVVHESYHPLACQDFSSLMLELKACRPDLILNTINGQGNVHFLTQLQSLPELSEPNLVCSISCSENMFSRLSDGAEGQLACWGYFQSVDTPGNRHFIEQLKLKDYHISSDPIATAYSQVLLWASIVERIGSFDPNDVRRHLVGSSIDSPLGNMEIEANHHIKRNALIGRCDQNGQFETIWQSDGPIEPLPFLGVGHSDLQYKKLILQILSELPEDITIHARLRTEMALRKEIADAMAKNQRQLKETEEIARIGGFERDLKTGEGYWSDTLYHMLGHSPGDFDPSLAAFEEHVVEEDREDFHRAFLTSVAEGKILDYQCRIQREDGEIRHVQIHSAVLHDENGHADHYHGTMMDITKRVLVEEALKESEQQMRLLAQTDELTGIFNRRRFMELALKEVKRANRYPAALSMIMFDVDKFKQVNDTYGHAVGDIVLKSIVDTAYSKARGVDILGRLGGEEFAIVLPNTNLSDATLVAERLRRDVEALEIPVKGEKLRITISLGVSELVGCAIDLDSILRGADMALYKAKDGGRNRVEVLGLDDLDAACTIPGEE